jgi:hypothetical protein
MLTGRLPFPGTSMMSVMYAHVHVPVPAIEELRAECPPELAAAVMRMLAKEPGERWPSIEEAVAALGHLTASQDEPTRSQLITLATTGSRPLTVRYTTPRSPIPFPRSSLGLSEAKTVQIGVLKSRRGVGAAVTGVGVLLAAAIYFAPWRRPAAEAPPAAPVAAAGDQPADGAQQQGATVASEPTKPAETPGTSATGAPKRGSKAAAGAAAPETTAPAQSPAEAPAVVVAVSVVDMEEPADAGAPKREISGSDAMLGRVAAPGAVSPKTRAAIERVLKGYAQGLTLGDMSEALRRYPGMSGTQQEQLGGFFATGGRYSIRWKVSGLQVSGNRAVAQLTGSTTEIRGGAYGSTRVVNEQVGFARQGNAWELTQIAQ